MKPSFLADESVEARLISFLRSRSYDVVSISEESPGVDDEIVLGRAMRERRILITNDKDFGYLIYFQGLPHYGIILLRFVNQKVQFKIEQMGMLFEAVDVSQFVQKFVVISEKGVKVKEA